MSANPIISTLAALLENAASAALNLDPAARAQIAELDEQILLVELTTTPPAALRINCSAIGGGRLSIMADSEHNTRTPNAIVRGSVANFIAALLPSDGHGLPAGIEIEGDERLLLALQNCFRNLQPNWREPLEAIAATFAQRFTSTNANPGAPPLFQDLLGQAELAFATLRTAFTDVVDNSKDQAADLSAKFWAQDDDLEAFASRLENLQLNVDRLRAELAHRDNTASSGSDKE